MQYNINIRLSTSGLTSLSPIFTKFFIQQRRFQENTVEFGYLCAFILAQNRSLAGETAGTTTAETPYQGDLYDKYITIFLTRYKS
jgi:hypothetical protein